MQMKLRNIGRVCRSASIRRLGAQLCQDKISSHEPLDKSGGLQHSTRDAASPKHDQTQPDNGLRSERNRYVGVRGPAPTATVQR
jgi:hypothetical protein